VGSAPKQCFNPLLSEPETLDGLRRFAERDHPDRRRAKRAKTPGPVRLVGG
jgi:enoyl-CoA hydratase